MLFSKRFLVLAIFLVGLLAVSAVGAAENTTDEIISDGMELEDESATVQDVDEGNYQDLNRLILNTSEGGTLKLEENYKNDGGSYYIGIHKAITIDGQGHTIDASGQSRVFYIDVGGVKLKNITFINGNPGSNSGGAIVFREGTDSEISDCSFINCSGDYGGALYFSAGSTSVITNTSFTNCSAQFGGAISFSNVSLIDITDCSFKYNNAEVLGGCIFGSIGSVSVRKTSFSNSNAKYESGGAISILSTNFIAEYIEVTDCVSEFGGAVTLLNTNSTISKSRFRRNSALYDGGAIFAMYGNITLEANNFSDSLARRGGGVYTSLTNFYLTNNRFTNNSATAAGAVFSMTTNLKENSANIYDNNHGNPEDLYQCVNDNLTIFAEKYYQFTYQDSEDEPLPGYYSMIDEHLLTPVKDQGTEGNCWAFSAMATLESCILKASNITLDLSEANLKNLMAVFSDYGRRIMVNDGGVDEMTFGYLASWLGPIFEEDDNYNIHDYLSPLLQSQLHIQNIIMFKRTDFTDNDAIKDAIIRYGAVSTGMYYDYAYLKNRTSYYYDGDSNSSNHAVCIVGWDDSYSKDNFLNTPEADGAWIVRNSWGPSWGNGGYFYVSYYDKLFATVNKTCSYTFILNDTVRLNRIYQHEIEYTNRQVITSDEVSFKSIFRVEGSEYLAAVSTYFLEECSYNVTVTVNGHFLTSKTGRSSLGYYTIYLDNLFYLNKDDEVEVQFTFSDYDNENGTIAVSSVNENTNLNLTEGMSYYWTGVRWKDYYIEGCVACIKMFTSVGGEGKIEPVFNVESDFDVLDNTSIINLMLPGQATGTVIIKNGDDEYTVNITETRTVMLYNVSADNCHLILSYSGDDKYFDKAIYHTINTAVPMGTYEEFKAKLNSLRPGDVLVLRKDYSFSGYVALNKPITIDGRGHTISGGNVSSIFVVYNDNITIENVRFIDANDSAVSVHYSNATLINCSFVNNFAADMGGAVYWIGVSGKVINCSFISNRAGEHGGAIFWSGINGSVENSLFDNDSAGMYGGAIYWSGVSGHINNCSFTSNVAGEYGGAIIWRSESGHISNSIFTNNSASTNSGGAIFVNANGFTVINSNFTDNRANNQGGAVYINGKNMNMSNSTFIHNAGKTGGAFYWIGDGGTLGNCSFVRNEASKYGGAVYSGSNGILSNSSFVHNMANEIGGAVLWSNEYGYFVDLTFEDNICDSVGAFYCYGAHASLVNSTFINSIGNLQIYWCNDTGNIEGCRFLKTTTGNIRGHSSILTKRDLDLKFNNTEFAHGNPQNVSIYADILKEIPIVTQVSVTLSKDLDLRVFFIKFTDGIAVIDNKVRDYDIGVWEGAVSFVGDDNYNSFDQPFTLTVYNIESKVNVSCENGTVGHGIRVTAYVFDTNGNPVTDGKVTFFNETDVIDEADVRNGVATGIFVPTEGGKHKIRAVFSSDNYRESEGTCYTYIDAVRVEVTAKSGTVGYENTVTAKVNALYSIVNEGTVSFYVNDALIGSAPVINGTANCTYTPLNASNGILKAVFDERYKYTKTEGTAAYTVNKAESRVSIEYVTGGVGDVLKLKASITSPNGLVVKDGTVTFYDNGNRIGQSGVLNGLSTLDYAFLKSGHHVVSAIFDSDNYLSNESEFETEIGKSPTVVSIADIANVYCNVPYAFSVSVMSNGHAVNEGTVKIFINGREASSVNVANGKVSFTYTFADAGSYNITAAYLDNADYYSSEDFKAFSVSRQPTGITSGNVNIVYNNAGYLTATLIGVDGKAIAGKTIRVSFNGVRTLTTDSNGQIRLLVSNLAPNTYNAVFTFDGDGSYLASSASAKVIVAKGASKIVAKNAKFKKSKKVKKYSVTLKDARGMAIKKVRLTLKVKGKTYKATTNAKGKATFKIKNLKKKGKFKATVRFAGNAFYNGATKKVRITVKK